jgi:hypothetical protein
MAESIKMIVLDCNNPFTYLLYQVAHVAELISKEDFVSLLCFVGGQSYQLLNDYINEIAPKLDAFAKEKDIKKIDELLKGLPLIDPLKNKSQWMPKEVTIEFTSKLALNIVELIQTISSNFNLILMYKDSIKDWTSKYNLNAIIQEVLTVFKSSGFCIEPIKFALKSYNKDNFKDDKTDATKFKIKFNAPKWTDVFTKTTEPKSWADDADEEEARKTKITPVYHTPVLAPPSAKKLYKTCPTSLYSEEIDKAIDDDNDESNPPVTTSATSGTWHYSHRK